ncbi:hypothetical protein PS15p_200370 [Mucor circinelloides]
MPYRRQEYELMAKRFILPQSVALVALNIMLIFSNQLLFISTSVSRFWYYAYLIYQFVNAALALIGFALIVKVHRTNFNLIDIIVGIHGSVLNTSKSAVICYSVVVILLPYTISLFKGQTLFGIFGSILMYIFFVSCLLLSLLPLQSLNPLSPLWTVITRPIGSILIAVPAIPMLVTGFSQPIDQQAARIARAQNGTYLVRHESGAFVSYHPPYGNAMGRLQDDIMYLQRLERQEEERRMAMEYERRARIFDDMERRGVQFASYVYYT